MAGIPSDTVWFTPTFNITKYSNNNSSFPDNTEFVPSALKSSFTGDNSIWMMPPYLSVPKTVVNTGGTNPYANYYDGDFVYNFNSGCSKQTSTCSKTC